jgi:hypothetical protein
MPEEGAAEGSRSELDDRDVLPVVQPVGLDGHRDVVGIEPHRHVELEVGGDLDAQRAPGPRSRTPTSIEASCRRPQSRSRSPPGRT